MTEETQATVRRGGQDILDADYNNILCQLNADKRVAPSPRIETPEPSRDLTHYLADLTVQVSTFLEDMTEKLHIAQKKFKDLQQATVLSERELVDLLRDYEKQSVVFEQEKKQTNEYWNMQKAQHEEEMKRLNERVQFLKQEENKYQRRCLFLKKQAQIYVENKRAAERGYVEPTLWGRIGRWLGLMSG